jgi:hypothetical protein
MEIENGLGVRGSDAYLANEDPPQKAIQDTMGGARNQEDSSDFSSVTLPEARIPPSGVNELWPGSLPIVTSANPLISCCFRFSKFQSNFRKTSFPTSRLISSNCSRICTV